MHIYIYIYVCVCIYIYIKPKPTTSNPQPSNFRFRRREVVSARRSWRQRRASVRHSATRRPRWRRGCRPCCSMPKTPRDSRTHRGRVLNRPHGYLLSLSLLPSLPPTFSPSLARSISPSFPPSISPSPSLSHTFSLTHTLSLFLSLSGRRGIVGGLAAGAGRSAAGWGGGG